MIQHLATLAMISRRRIRRFLIHNMLHVDDPPHRLALGAALGVFITFTPTVGVQMVLVVFLAWLLRANKVIGVPIVWLSNPATIVPIYYSCYVIGRKILGTPPIGQQWWHQLGNPPGEWWPAVTFYWSKLVDVAVPLWVGCIVVGLATAYPTYYVTYHLICRYRLKRWGQLTRPSREQRRRVRQERREGTDAAAAAGEAVSRGGGNPDPGRRAG